MGAILSGVGSKELPITTADMKAVGIAKYNIIKLQKHTLRAIKFDIPPRPNCFIPVVISRIYLNIKLK